MTRHTRANDWRPIGGHNLEEGALSAVRAPQNCLIVAGPGAGKTEVLAQRASYLLETGMCPVPRRILALCFKRDAAKNLAERVEARCGKELASRLDSRTYDAFAKSLVDQFSAALPAHLRPTADYVLEMNIESALRRVVDPSSLGRRLKDLAREHSRHPLRHVADEEYSLDEIFANLVNLQPSILTFPMITALGETLLLESTPIRNAVRCTYSHAFLDEFQDTTTAQYRLLSAAFMGSQCHLTAVGDPKQRIMVWAGADREILAKYRRDFSAARIDLSENHRSAPHLVDIQRALAARMGESMAAISAGNASRAGGSCEIQVFDSYISEARAVAATICDWINGEGCPPRSICVLVKQKVDLYSSALVGELAAMGIKSRSEVKLQDLLAEPASATVVAVLRLVTPGQWPGEYDSLLQFFLELQGIDRDDISSQKALKAERRFEDFLADLERQLCLAAPHEMDRARILHFVENIFEFLGAEAYRAVYRQYSVGDYFDSVLSDLSIALESSIQRAGTLGGALDDFLGLEHVPVMTIHKSKGLEFDAVVFLGLEDGAFWSFATQEEEDMRAVFVALSRARRHVLFTYSEIRNSGFEGREQREGRRKIEGLYKVLMTAGVRLVRRRDDVLSGAE